MKHLRTKALVAESDLVMVVVAHKCGLRALRVVLAGDKSST